MNIDLKRLKIDMKSNHFCYKSGTRNLQIRSQSRYGYTLRRLLQNNNSKMATTNKANDKREELRNLTSQCQNMTSGSGSGSGKGSSPKTRQKPRPKKFSKVGPKSYMKKVQISKFCSIAKRTRMASGLLKRASMRLKIRESKNFQKENHMIINRTVEYTINDLDYGSEKSKLLFLCGLNLIPKESALKQPRVLVKRLPENQAKELLLKRQKQIDERVFLVDNCKKRVIPNFSRLIDDNDDDIIIDKFVRHDIGIALERVNNSDFKLIRCNIGNVLKPPLQSQPKYHGQTSSIVHPISTSLYSLDPSTRIKSYTSMAQSKPPMRLYQPQQPQQQQQQQQQYLQVPQLANQQRRQTPIMIPFPSTMNRVKKTVAVKPNMRNSPCPRPRSLAAEDDDDDLIIEKVILHQKSYKVFQLDKFLESESLKKSRQLNRDPFVNIDALKDTLKDLNTEITML